MIWTRAPKVFLAYRGGMGSLKSVTPGYSRALLNGHHSLPDPERAGCGVTRLIYDEAFQDDLELPMTATLVAKDLAGG